MPQYKPAKIGTYVVMSTTSQNTYVYGPFISEQLGYDWIRTNHFGHNAKVVKMNTP